ncbi:hypothetical protein MG293_002377 [Ovis ammon polii]|uniref:Uncharacterized protein n=1 Tax=Ovis ammon polii TaxID=230172 RepID=A0AAD4UG00_OVIAM|nr:hypothetical protein MG293_002377 [Ovis ammon polii]
MGSATTCRLSASNAATAPFPERVPVLLLVAFASQLIGETLRPVWGPMDKCYPVTTQAMTPKALRAPKDAAPKEETAVLSREERQENKKAQKETAVYVSGQTADPTL